MTRITDSPPPAGAVCARAIGRRTNSEKRHETDHKTWTRRRDRCQHGGAACGQVENVDWESCRLVLDAAEKRRVSERKRGDFPQNIWAVTHDGYPLEAQLENETKGSYHGYPMPTTDPFRDEVLERWNKK